jgi:uncharacterized sulfatase
MHMPFSVRCLLCVIACLPLAAAQPASLTLQRVADGVYVVAATGVRAAAENGGHVFNTGVLVGPTGVVVIDPGPSAAFGARLRAAVAALTPKPVVLLINTHAQAEVALANSAFPGVPARAHPLAARFMDARCTVCLANLRAVLGDDALAGTAIVVPQPVDDRVHVITAGGRRLRLLPFAGAANVADLAVLDEASGTLFSGALAAGRAVPDLHDADLAVWLAALERLWQQPFSTVVPGRGRVSRDALADTAGYLNALQRAARREVAAGTDLASVAVPLPQFEDWPGYDVLHAANLRRAFVQAEAQWLARQP